jgi:hypothetical protein
VRRASPVIHEADNEEVRVRKNVHVREERDDVRKGENLSPNQFKLAFKIITKSRMTTGVLVSTNSFTNRIGSAATAAPDTCVFTCRHTYAQITKESPGEESNTVGGDQSVVILPQ